MFRARLGVLAALLGLAAPASAVTVGYVEDFSADASGWVNSTFGPLTFNASGGPDGGSYVSATGPSINDPGTIQLRTNGPSSSGGNFAGNWLTAGITQLSAYVIHDAPVPVNFFFRITTGSNSPGIVGVVTTPVAPNTWTPISLMISPSNPLIVIEGPPSFYNTVLGNVTQVQVGVSVPLANEGISYSYGLDKVQVVPEPATALLLSGGLVLLARARRARR